MDINGRTLSEDKVHELIVKIKKKKELQTIDDEIVIHEIKRYLHKNSKLIDMFIQDKKIALQTIMKHVRSELRRLYGSYTTQIDSREKAKLNFISQSSEKTVTDLLLSHKSTAERYPYYEQFYKELFEITGKPTSIIDLGCGMNPLSFSFMNLKKVSYFAYDISTADLDILHSFFENKKEIDGTTSVINLFEAKSKPLFEGLPQFDLCFLFKVLEIIEQSKSHKISEKIITSVPAIWVVVSFPTKTISGKPMKHPRRGWIERMLERLSYSYSVLTFENEIYYVIKKSN